MSYITGDLGLDGMVFSFDFDGTVAEKYNSLGDLFEFAGGGRLGKELGERYAFHLEKVLEDGMSRSAEEEGPEKRLEALYVPLNRYELEAFRSIPPEALQGIYKEEVEEIGKRMELKKYAGEVLELLRGLGGKTRIVSMNYSPRVIESKVGGVVDCIYSSSLRFSDGKTTGEIKPGVVTPWDKTAYTDGAFFGDGVWDIPAIFYSSPGFLVGDDEKSMGIIKHTGGSVGEVETEEDVADAMSNPVLDVYHMSDWEAFYRYLKGL